MPQELSSQELTAGGGGINTGTGYASGTVCPRTGSYKCSNKYLDAIVTVVKGNKFPNGTDGRKTTWYALSSSSSSGDFTSVKAAPGAA